MSQLNPFWDNDSDYAHDEIGECERCGQAFDMWNQWGIEHKWCPTCRRKQREAKANGIPLEPITPSEPIPSPAPWQPWAASSP